MVPLPCSAQHLPAQEGSRRSPFLKERRGLRLAPLPAVSTPRGRDLPSFSFDFWGEQRSISAWGHPRLPLPFPWSPACFSVLSLGLGLPRAARKGPSIIFSGEGTGPCSLLPTPLTLLRSGGGLLLREWGRRSGRGCPWLSARRQAW